MLYFRGEMLGGHVSADLGLRFSLIHDIIDTLKLNQLVQVKRSLGMGNVSALFVLTEAGRNRARGYLESNQYAGPAPVPLAQYADMVRKQRRQENWLTREALAQVYSRMVLSDKVLSQIGPAVSAGNSLLIYGRPGDGKTYLAEALALLDDSTIYLPYAIEAQGNIVQVYDPIFHQKVEEAAPSDSISADLAADGRWARCRRPFIVSGGELTLDMLDLSFNAVSKIYDAPFHLKANNGIYLIDDFGRQRATPSEVLNRWIVPMERRVDFLNFRTGGKITVPFETFLVFSTNLQPEQLGDEAFLRRIQYKMLLRGPDEAEFREIFHRFCAARGLPCPENVLEDFIEKRYRRTGRRFRRCHPRDVLSHVINFLNFENLPFEVNPEVLDHAFESCFIEEEMEA